MKKIKTDTALYGKLAAGIFMLLIILMPAQIAEGAKRGLKVCGEVIIPSTFTFIALATFIIRAGGKMGKTGLAEKICNTVFKLPGSFLTALCMGLLSGYPVGAACIAELKRNGQLTKKQAERCLPFCVGAGPAFVISAVGKGFFGSFAIGLIIFFSQLLACVLLGLVTGILAGKEDNAETDTSEDTASAGIAECFVSSVKDTCFTILHVCAFVVFFSGLINIAEFCGFFDILCVPFGSSENTAVRILAGGFLEVTNGCAMSRGTSSAEICAASAVVGFGGMSVIFQIAATVEKAGIGMKRFIFSRAVTAVLSAFFAAMLTKIFPLSVETVSLSHVTAGYEYHSFPVCFVLAAFAVALIISDKRKGEITVQALTKCKK